MIISVLPSEEQVLSSIHWIRGVKVMLDEDLALLYGIPTKRLNEQVKRNADRFPADFMFQLNLAEFEHLKSQFATASWGGRRSLPYAFTEHGVLMLSSVLNNYRAIQVNIQIMRVYIKLRELLLSHKDMLLKLERLEAQVSGHSEDIRMVFEALKQLLQEPETVRNPIGYKAKEVPASS